MNKSFSWFILSILLLPGCVPNSTATPTESVVDLSPAPPEDSQSSNGWDMRIRVTTTSDWTTVRLVQGMVVDYYNIVSVSQGADKAVFDQDFIQLIQPIKQANSGQMVEFVIDLSIENKIGDEDLIIEIDRGHIGATNVEIYYYSCAQADLVTTLTSEGIPPTGENTERFTITADRFLQSIKNEYIVIAQLNFWYYGPGLYGGFENDYGQRNTQLTPLLGETYWASDPGVVYQQIEWAVKYGVDAFSIEWTTPRGVGCCGSMELTLDDVFLKSPNIDKIRWVLFYDFPLRLVQTSGLEQYAASLDFDEPDVSSTLVYDFRRFAQKYFGNPQYLTIDGRPVIYIWATNAFRGNVEKALADAREAVAEEGYDVFIVGDEVVAGQIDPHHASLFDGNSTFTFLIPGLPHKSWADIGDAIPDVDQAFKEWRNNIANLKVIGRDEYVNFQPAWAPQFDGRLVGPDPNSIYVPANSKDQVIAMAEMARNHAEPVGSQGQKLVWINTWNCWAETTTIEPTANIGPKYPAGNYQFDMLEVVRDVYGSETFACKHP